MDDTSATNALITGGVGFIGSHLVTALLDHGFNVTVIDDLSTGRFENISHLVSHPRFRLVIDSVTNEVVMDSLVSRSDLIFHMAAAVGVDLILRDPVRVIETNILGTHVVLKVADRYRKKVLIASTSEIYGKNNDVPFREDDDRLLGPTTKARWGYSTSKAADECLGLAYHRQMGLPVIIFRLFNTIGPRQTGQYGMVVPRFVQQALKGEPLTIYGDGRQTRCFCDVKDAVRAIIGLAECPTAVGQVFNIGSTEEVTILELARKVVEVVDKFQIEKFQVDGSGPKPYDLLPATFEHSNRIVFMPYNRAYGAGFEDMRRRVPDITKIKAAISWEPSIPLTLTLERIVTSHRPRLQTTTVHPRDS